MSVQALLDKSGLGIDRSSLARKLMPDGEKGALRLKAEEIDALALALGVVVTAGDEAGAS